MQFKIIVFTGNAYESKTILLFWQKSKFRKKIEDIIDISNLFATRLPHHSMFDLVEIDV